MTRSTGHAKRLARDTLAQALRFGDTNYSKEELVAEMGATVPSLEPTEPGGFARSLTGIMVGLARDPDLSVRQEAIRA